MTWVDPGGRVWSQLAQTSRLQSWPEVAHLQIIIVIIIITIIWIIISIVIIIITIIITIIIVIVIFDNIDPPLRFTQPNSRFWALSGVSFTLNIEETRLHMFNFYT